MESHTSESAQASGPSQLVSTVPMVLLPDTGCLLMMPLKVEARRPNMSGWGQMTRESKKETSLTSVGPERINCRVEWVNSLMWTEPSLPHSLSHLQGWRDRVLSNHRETSVCWRACLDVLPGPTLVMNVRRPEAAPVRHVLWCGTGMMHQFHKGQVCPLHLCALGNL